MSTLAQALSTVGRVLGTTFAVWLTSFAVSPVAHARLSTAPAAAATALSGAQAIHTNLEATVAQLIALRGQLDGVQARLTKLERMEARDEQALAAALVGSYETGRPGRDLQAVARVRAGRRAVSAEAAQYGSLTARAQTAAVAVLAQRNRLVRAQLRRPASGRRLASLRRQLTAIQADQAAAGRDRAPGRTPSGASPAPGPVLSRGGFTVPLPRSGTAPQSTWSSDAGVEIAAPADTPELAVCAGTVVLHGIGGAGPWAPVLRCDAPLAGHDYVYYGYAGSRQELAVGTHVQAGQVIGSVGSGIVGTSSGPQLEIGFCDSSGSPLGPVTAGAMLSLLRAASG